MSLKQNVCVNWGGRVRVGRGEGENSVVLVEFVHVCVCMHVCLVFFGFFCLFLHKSLLK